MDEAFAQKIGLIAAFIVMLLVHPIFAAILFIWAVVFLSIAFYFAKNIKNLADLFAQSKNTLVGRLVDSVSNIMNVRAFSRNDFEEKYINEAVSDTVVKDRKMQWYMFRMYVLFDVSVISLIAGMLFALIYMFSKGLVTVGDFAFVISLSMSMFFNLWFLARQLVMFSEHLGKCSQSLTLINKPHEIIDAKNAIDLKIRDAVIEFKNVKFSYNENGDIFKNKNIKIASGEKIGLVGFSGSGKSCLLYTSDAADES